MSQAAPAATPPPRSQPVTLTSPPRRPPRSRKRLRLAGLIVLFAVALVGSRTAIDAVFELRPAGSFANDVFHKLAVAEETLGDYDVVYIGSSRSRRAFKPEVFERELAALGVDVEAFNLGLPGLLGLGQDYVLEQLLERGDAGRLRLLILAPDEIGVALGAREARTDRKAMWHDLRHTEQALRAVAASPAGVLDKVRWSWSHVDALLLRAAVSGRIANRVNHRVRENANRVLGPAGDGYVPNPRHTEGLPGRVAGAAEVAAAEAVPPPPPTESERDLLDSLAGSARAHGVPVLFVREPILSAQRSRFLRWIARNDPTVPVLDLGNPGTHPELFDPGLFHDLGHLNDDGATVFSRLLAHRAGAELLAAG